jgi:adenine C2-methylase RlmN of 23S rRNA A2503 and tRNA A37
MSEEELVKAIKYIQSFKNTIPYSRKERKEYISLENIKIRKEYEKLKRKDYS